MTDTQADGSEDAPITTTGGYETTVPEDATPVRCPYCDQPFAREQYRTLHVGLEHYDRIDEDEYEAFEDAYAAESDELRTYRLKLLAVLVFVYFGFLFVYAVVT